MDFLRGTHDDRLNIRPIALVACFGWGLLMGLGFMVMRAPPLERAGFHFAGQPAANPSDPSELDLSGASNALAPANPADAASPAIETRLTAVDRMTEIELAVGQQDYPSIFDPTQMPLAPIPRFDSSKGLHAGTAPLPETAFISRPRAGRAQESQPIINANNEPPLGIYHGAATAQPSVDVVARPIDTPPAAQVQTQGQVQPQGQAQNQTQGQAQIQGQAQPQGQAQTQLARSDSATHGDNVGTTANPTPPGALTQPSLVTPPLTETPVAPVQPPVQPPSTPADPPLNLPPATASPSSGRDRSELRW